MLVEELKQAGGESLWFDIRKSPAQAEKQKLKATAPVSGTQQEVVSIKVTPG
jgi:hypothetical protein